MTPPNIAESISPEQREAEQPSPSQTPPYQLRRNGAPRYRCETCGSRNCTCVNLIEMRTPVKRLARGADAPAHDLADTETFEEHLRHTTRSIQATNPDVPLVHHVVTTMEKTYSSIGPGVVPPLEITLKAMQGTSPPDCPTYQFKEWTWHEKSGLKFTLAANIPPFSTVNGVWKNRARRHKSSLRYAVLPCYRAPAIATIRRDLSSWRCMSPNGWLVAISHPLGRNVTSDSRNSFDLSREFTHARRVR